jgi:hypothetical protein
MLAVFVACAAMCAAVAGASASSASAAGIVHPADNSFHQSSPVDFRGEADDLFISYFPAVSLYLHFQEQEFISDPFGGKLQNKYVTLPLVGAADDAVDIDWDYHAPMSSFTNRVANPAGPSDPPLPDGTPLTDGKYLLQVTQNHLTDPSSNLNWYSTFWVDSKAPDTVIDSATPPAPTNSTSRSFTFHAEDQTPLESSGTKLECSLDGAPWTDCTNPFADPTSPSAKGSFSASGLGEGNHTFSVRARDRAGNVDPTPAVANWIVDLTPPEITITKPAMRERFVLDQNVPAVVTCTDPLAGAPPVASGIDTCSHPSPVNTSQLGNFRFVVTAVDNAGNTSTKVHSYAVDPPRYADVINANNPIAYYRLSEPLGSDPMLDSSGNNRHGEYKNGIALRRPPAVACHVRPHAPYVCDLTSDPQDFAAWFPARDGYGFTNGITAPKTAYTLEGWIKRADNGDGSVVGHGGGGQLFIKDGRLALRQVQDTVQSAGPVLTPGQWFHVAATWNGSVTRLYVNGTQVASSSTANKPPSGISTFYVGYGDQAPWFHGSLDEVAYYGSALSGSAIRKRWVVGTAKDVPGPIGGPPIQRPSAHIDVPENGGLYAPTKVPHLHFHCEDLDGDATVTSCTATVDGLPALDGSPLPDTPGEHVVVVTAVDEDGLTRDHTHRYYVRTFEQIYNADSPIAYYRLGDATGGPMKDSSGNGRDGIYKNYQQSGPFGISGDLDRARRFHGEGGYGYVNDIAAPRFQSTLEAWVNPDDGRDQSVLGHGDAGEIYIEGGLFKFRHMGTTVTATVGPVPGIFTQVAAVWDGVTISLYVDGVLRGQTEATKRPSSISTFYVGYGEIKPWFKGSIDEVAYYDRALTPARVYQHWLADPPPPPEGEGSGTETGSPGGSQKPPPLDEVGDSPVDDPTETPGEDPGSETGDDRDPPALEDVGPSIGGPESQSGGPKGDRPRQVGKKAKVKAAKRQKCRKIQNANKRRACLKRVS